MVIFTNRKGSIIKKSEIINKLFLTSKNFNNFVLNKMSENGLRFSGEKNNWEKDEIKLINF
jgi:hypothetical protein